MNAKEFMCPQEENTDGLPICSTCPAVIWRTDFEDGEIGGKAVCATMMAYKLATASKSKTDCKLADPMTAAQKYHAEICDSLKTIYAQKNADYGDSFARARREIPYYTLGKLYDKFSRIQQLLRHEETHLVKDEAVEDTLLDMANYCIMELAERRAEEDNAG